MDWDDTDTDSSASPPPRPDPARQMLTRPNSRPLPATARLDGGGGRGGGMQLRPPPISPIFRFLLLCLLLWVVLVLIFTPFSVSFYCFRSRWRLPQTGVAMKSWTQPFFPRSVSLHESRQHCAAFSKTNHSTGQFDTQIHWGFTPGKAKKPDRSSHVSAAPWGGRGPQSPSETPRRLPTRRRARHLQAWAPYQSRPYPQT